VLTACTHKERAITRGRAWGDLGLFLELVERGEVPSALEEAQVAARADPRKEKARAKRIEERNRMFEMRDMDAFLRLSKAGYMLRKTHQAKKVEERKHKTAAQKANAIRVVRQLFALMMSHQDGWTLMIGMPSSKLLKDIVEMKGSDAPMMSSMSAEVRRFQRAVGMTAWEIITGHNRGVLPLDLTREGAIRNWVAGGLGVGDAVPLAEPPCPPKGERGKIFRQTALASFKLLPDDAAALMDAMEYEQDVWAAEAAALDVA